MQLSAYTRAEDMVGKIKAESEKEIGAEAEKGIETGAEKGIGAEAETFVMTDVIEAEVEAKSITRKLVVQAEAKIEKAEEVEVKAGWLSKNTKITPGAEIKDRAAEALTVETIAEAVIGELVEAGVEREMVIKRVISQEIVAGVLTGKRSLVLLLSLRCGKRKLGPNPLLPRSSMRTLLLEM